MNIAEGLLPVFFALAVGYAAGRLHIIDNRHIDGLNTLVMTIALPLALFTILAGSERADVVEHGAVAGAVFIVMALVYAATYVLQRRVYRESSASSAVQALTVAFPNTAAVGLPIAGAVLGSTGELAVAVSLAVGSITLSPVTITILERAGTPAAAEAKEGGTAAAPQPSHPDGPAPAARTGTARAFGRSLRTPVVIAPVLGLVWSLAGLPFPKLLDTTLMEIGGLTAGLALFVTGLVLSGQRLALTSAVAASTLIGDVVRPALAFVVVLVLGITGAMATEVVILMAIPSGFFGVLLALSHGLRADTAGPTLFYSTVLSVVTLSAVILLMPPAT